MDLRPRSSVPVPPDAEVHSRTRRARTSTTTPSLGHARPKTPRRAILSTGCERCSLRRGRRLPAAGGSRDQDRQCARTLDRRSVGHALLVRLTMRTRRSLRRDAASARASAASVGAADSSLDLSCLAVSWEGRSGSSRFRTGLGGAYNATATSPRRRSTRRPHDRHQQPAEPR